MSAPDDAVRLRVLHALRLTGFADTPVVAARAGLRPAAVATVLDAAASCGEVRRREGRLAGWLLTPAGRTAGETLVAAELDRAGARPAVRAAYDRFVALNGELLEVCSAWQVRDQESGTLNDHADAAYDAAVVDRLGAIHERVVPVCGDLSASLDRFAGYEPRLAAALARVRAGEPEWFAKPLIDSYHTVWFELHEDLLATLGLARSAETVATGRRDVASGV